MPGIIELREIIAQKTEEMYSMVYDPETEITITAGGTQALYTAINAFVREEDENVFSIIFIFSSCSSTTSTTITHS